MGLPLGLAVRLLPTPRSSDTNGAASHGDGGPDLRTAVSLLPTPQASEHSASRETAEQRAATGHQAYLSHVMTSLTTAQPRPEDGGTHWGQYAAAIARWEALTRPAPQPVDEHDRLSPAFVEWLMGLDEGHVTDVDGLSRGARLRALGNGVVPNRPPPPCGCCLAVSTTFVSPHEVRPLDRRRPPLLPGRRRRPPLPHRLPMSGPYTRRPRRAARTSRIANPA